MICRTINCFHKAAHSNQNRGKWWEVYQVCTCCWKEIQMMNPTEKEFFIISLIIYGGGRRCTLAKRNYGRHEEVIVN